MSLRFAAACFGVALLGAAAAPAASPTPVPDAAGERIFAQARAAWRDPSPPPYVRYGALVRYQHGKHVVDTWWDAVYRSSDGAIALNQLHDAAAENRRLRGVPFSIFGFQVFDTNPDAEPIRIDAPQIAPIETFGVRSHVTLEPDAQPSTPAPLSTGLLRQISHIVASTRVYQVRLVGTETIAGAPAEHLSLVPLSDPAANRLRDLWVDPQTDRTVQLRIQGLFQGKPYNAIAWTVRYVLIDGHNYLQQIVADEPLRFGFETVIPKYEFDFVDYHFPTSEPQGTFDRTLF